jgi:hypothetical protein
MTMLTTGCPECGADLEFDSACVIDEPIANVQRNGAPRRRHRVAPVALCTRCEFVIEVRPHAA